MRVDSAYLQGKFAAVPAPSCEPSLASRPRADADVPALSHRPQELIHTAQPYRTLPSARERNASLKQRRVACILSVPVILTSFTRENGTLSCRLCSVFPSALWAGDLAERVLSAGDVPTFCPLGPADLGEQPPQCHRLLHGLRGGGAARRPLQRPAEFWRHPDHLGEDGLPRFPSKNGAH